MCHMHTPYRFVALFEYAISGKELPRRVIRNARDYMDIMSFFGPMERNIVSTECLRV